MARAPTLMLAAMNNTRPAVRIRPGVMGMASNTDDAERVSQDFAAIAGVYKEILRLCPDLRGFDTLSMGMSGDWRLAVEHGSNMVRIGTAIFGEREY